MKRRPCAFLFLSALTGAFFGCEFGLSMRFFSLAMASLLTILIFRHQLVRIACVLLVTFSVTAFFAAWERERYIDTLSLLSGKEETFFGKVMDMAKKEDGTTAIVRAHLVSDPQKRLICLRLTLQDALAFEPLEHGSIVRFKGHARPNSKPLSLVHFDGFRFGLAHHVHGSLTLTAKSSLWVGERISWSYFGDLRSLLSERILKVLPPREASLLLALMIGNTDLLSDEQNEIYREIGAQHLLAVSGLQVTILAAICFFLLIPFFGFILPRRFSHRAQAFAAIITIFISFWFIGVTGFPSSAVRAFLMACILLLPNFIARPIDPFDKQAR